MDDVFKLAEELYDDHISHFCDRDSAWEAAKDEATEIVQRQRRDEDRQSDRWSSSPKRRK